MNFLKKQRYARLKYEKREVITEQNTELTLCIVFANREKYFNVTKIALSVYVSVKALLISLQNSFEKSQFFSKKRYA